MTRFASIAARHKLWFAATLILLIAASCVSFVLDITSGRVDADIVNYLGNGFDSREGLSFLQDTFGVNGDIMIAVEGEDNDADLARRIGDINALDGVAELVWYGTLEEAGTWFENIDWLLKLVGKTPGDIYDDTELKKYLRRQDGGRFTYIVLMLTEYSPSSMKAFSLLGDVEGILEGRAFATAGMTSTSRNIMRNTLKEIPIYVLFAGIGMYLVLLLASESWLEPVVILVPLAAAVLLNAGTNFLFSRISVVSLAACAVLQLTITTDFGLIINSFLKKTEGENARGLLGAVLSGSVVTAGALAALFAMRFGLGADLAMSAIKASAISLASAFILVPLTRAFLQKGLLKTRMGSHPHFRLDRFSSYVLRMRWGAIACALVLTVIAGFVFTYPDCSYFKIYDRTDTRGELAVLAGEMENQLILAVPVVPDEGFSQQDYVRELEELESVDKVIGVFPALKTDPNVIALGLELLDFSGIPHINAIFRKSGETWYTFSIVVLRDGAESAQAEKDYRKIKEISARYFPDAYAFGLLSGVHDMKSVSEHDFYRILFLSTGITLILSVLVLFSFKKGLAVGLLAAAAVVMNIALEGAVSDDTNFIIYLILPAVQMSSVVNIGMLLARRYGERIRLGEQQREAAAGALRDSLPVAAISLMVLLICLLSVFFVTKNLIIKDLAMLLLRGNVFGYLLMIFVLPGILSLENIGLRVLYRKF
jgi:predicted RND superfamily exporter protein